MEHVHHRMFDPVEQSVEVEGVMSVKGVCKRSGCPEPVVYRATGSLTYGFAERKIVMPTRKTVLPHQKNVLGDERFR